MEVTYTLYMHTCPSGKRYIGITSKPVKTRWNGGRGYPNNRYFTRAINKYGWEAIVHEILMSGLTEPEAVYWERFYIALFRTFSPKYGYNQTTGGEVCKEYSEDARRRMSEAQKGERSHAYGKHFSEEHRRRMSEALKGRRFSEEHRRKLSEAAKRREYQPFSEEHCRKIGDALRGRKHSEEHRRKNGAAHSRAIVNRDTGERYDSIASAAKKYGVTCTAIGNCLRGKNKTAAGFHWEYCD